MKCKNCGAEVEQGNNFCANCGISLNSKEAVSEIAPKDVSAEEDKNLPSKQKSTAKKWVIGVSIAIGAVITILIIVFVVLDTAEKIAAINPSALSYATEETTEEPFVFTSDKTWTVFEKLQFDFDGRFELNPKTEHSIDIELDSPYMNGGIDWLWSLQEEPLAATHSISSDKVVIENRAITIHGCPALRQKFTEESDFGTKYFSLFVLRYDGYDYTFILLSDYEDRELCDTAIDEIINTLEFVSKAEEDPTGEEAEKPTKEPTEPPTEATKRYNAGQYKVGVDIEPGIYLAYATGSSGNGYYSITSDANGEDIISNDYFAARSYVEIESGEYLELSRCYIVSLSDTEPYQSSDGTIPPGQYLVGRDIDAGEYNVTALGSNGNGYYAVTSDANGEDIISNDYFSENSYVTVADGQYLELSRAQID